MSTPGKQATAAVADSNTAPDVADTGPKDQTESTLRSASGKELKERDAQKLAEARQTQMIVLAGPIDSGKTTLVTSLYEIFQWKAIDGYAFAGSQTLSGFEERCFLSRKASGRHLPETQRTPYSGPDPSYLHLRVRSTGELRLWRDFLFTDVSGEMFEHARDSTEECKDLTFLKRANHFLLLLDSGKGVDPSRRWAMVEDGKALLRSILDSAMLPPYCSVNIVWGRFDYFAAVESDQESEHEQFRSQVEAEFRSTFTPQVKGLTFTKVAARPRLKPALGFGYGVHGLLRQWAEAPLGRSAQALLPTHFSGGRESELFGQRHFQSVNDKNESRA